MTKTRESKMKKEISIRMMVSVFVEDNGKDTIEDQAKAALAEGINMDFYHAEIESMWIEPSGEKSRSINEEIDCDTLHIL